MENKICIVTGSSSGIGYGLASRLASMKAKLVMLSRENQRGKEAYNALLALNNRAIWIPTDLSSPQSVKRFIKKFKSIFNRCDLLFNCAGVQVLQRNVTNEGFELMMATNYLGHFLLTNMLFDSLQASSNAKVIIVSGSSHKASYTEGLNTGTMNFDNLHGEQGFNFPRQSKQVVLAKILFTYELARRWDKYGIDVCTISPGLVKTGLVDHLPWTVRAYFNLRCWLTKAQSPEQAANHLIALALREDINGKYFEADRGELVETKSSPESYDQDIAKKLWEVSEAMLGQRFTYTQSPD